MYNPSRHWLPPRLAGRGGPRQNGRESNAQVDCRCLCSDLGVISTGFATRIPPTARQTGHSSPRSMRRRYAPREWCLRENSRPPCRQQVRSRSDLLGHGTSWTPGLETQQGEVGDRPMTETFGPASIRWPDVAYWTEADDPACPRRFSDAGRAQTVPRSPAAGVRKPPREEIAGWDTWRCYVEVRRTLRKIEWGA